MVRVLMVGLHRSFLFRSDQQASVRQVLYDAWGDKKGRPTTYKFGIEVPKIWDDGVRLDKDNDNTLWKDAVRKDMKNVRIAFKILNGEEAVPPTYQEIRCHIISDVKMEDFRRKARFVAGDHTTDTPHTMNYASVVSRESARVALTLAVLNDLDVKMANSTTH
jgi:hypothetical protein